jgi:hypothetical protein
MQKRPLGLDNSGVAVCRPTTDHNRSLRSRSTSLNRPEQCEAEQSAALLRRLFSDYICHERQRSGLLCFFLFFFCLLTFAFCKLASLAAAARCKEDSKRRWNQKSSLFQTCAFCRLASLAAAASCTEDCQERRNTAKRTRLMSHLSCLQTLLLLCDGSGFSSDVANERCDGFLLGGRKRHFHQRQRAERTQHREDKHKKTKGMTDPQSCALGLFRLKKNVSDVTIARIAWNACKQDAME